ncbi:hypothetical protein ACHAWO_008208 [Cyclotella atomus]|uniref:Uncharacterized protein n=1 Tax=Cyclotella atomus TaxID=382360 RepID=A0ABD3NZS4_9STRA
MEIPEYSDDGEDFYDAGEECSPDDEGAAKDLKENPLHVTLCAHYHAAFHAHLH